ncbi:hypothetical protein ABW20_dc0108966 [Dactylellina cionopaga]|nr:hypothetical protein ABW20_dc0108966 [Dactylellina cionopaga]
MTALPSASRSLQRLTQTALARSNGSSLPSLCYRCQALGLPHDPTTSLAVAQSQKRFINIKWGSKTHVPKVAGRKGKRQRLIDLGQKHNPLQAPKLTNDEIKEVYAPELFVFRSDLSAGNISQAMTSLVNLVELGILRPMDSLSLAQALHHAYRSRRISKATMLNYMNTLIGYLKSGELPTHYFAQVHVLSTLKEAEEWDMGNDYWGWLKTKGLDFLDARVFGAVIEFLAYQGAPLAELEELYALSLEKFSKQQDEGGGMQHRATSLTLIQGISTARVLNADWRAGYEGLDVAARLHPTQVPTRLYEVFVFNRPVKEAYLIFLMACRAGTKLSIKNLMWLINNWWKGTGDVRGMLQLLLAHLSIGGQVGTETMGKMIFVFLGRLPEAPEPPAPLSTLVKAELGATGTGDSEVSPEEAEKERKAWEEWDRRMEEYQEAVNPMFECIRQTIELFQNMSIEPSVSTYCNIISQASRRHLKQIVVAAMRELEGKVRTGAEMEESSWRVMLNAYGFLADQDGVRRTWDALTNWRRNYLRTTMKATDGRTWKNLGEEDLEARNHELISWKALIRACFDVNMKPFILEQLRKYEREFGERLTREIRWELHRREGDFQKARKSEVEMLHDAVVQGKDAITTASPKTNAIAVPADYKALKTEIQSYRQMLDAMVKVIKSPVAYEFSTLNLDLGILGVPPMSDEDLREMKEVYEHFQRNMPRNPFLTASNDPKMDLAGIQKKVEESKNGDREAQGGAWGEERSVTGYTINQLRFENWLTINRLLYLAGKPTKFVELHLGVKGVRSGAVRREEKAKLAIERYNSLKDREVKNWEERAMAIRASLVT